MPDPKRSLYADAGVYNTGAAAVEDLQQLTIDQIAAAVGGPTHQGHEMRLSHAGIGLTGDAHAALTRNLAAILDKLKITEKARTEAMAIFANLESQVVDE